VAIDYYNHDDHSAYLILNAELPGFTQREIVLMALLAHYHRRGKPDVTPFKGVLTCDDEERAARLGALLRLAEYLDRSQTQVVRSIHCRIQDSSVQIVCRVHGEATMEVWATERNADLFKQVFKREVKVVTQPLKAVETVPQLIGVEAAPTAEPLWTRAQKIAMLLKVRS
jgi:exopolyphosphatase/guanosine-5'-triphosphate,3'-diphosphate pyrophosphatase